MKSECLPRLDVNASTPTQPVSKRSYSPITDRYRQLMKV